jgi:hypothetical protein
MPILSFVICAQLTEYFSTRRWFLSKNVLKVKMRRFRKNPCLNSLVLWIRRRSTNCKLERSVWVVRYTNSTRRSVGILLSRCGQFKSYYHTFCCNMFVFACPIIARRQCWLFALRAISVFALKISVFSLK